MKALQDHLVECFKAHSNPRLHFVLHHLVKPVEEEDAFINHIRTQLEDDHNMVNFLFEFCLCVVCLAFPLKVDSLIDLKIVVRKHSPIAKHGLGEKLLNEIQKQIVFESPILGRWSADPWNDMLGWMKWADVEVANALTSICEPFFRLRAWEFSSKPIGPHLQHLNNVANALSMYVSSSILVGCAISQKEGSNVAGRWIGVMEHLFKLGNFHMLYAVAMGLGKHQVDRLSFVWENLTSKASKTKKKMDRLFDPTDRMSKVSKMWLSRAGKEPTIISIFWLVQKATLFEETPLLIGVDHKINPDALVASENIFGQLAKMQSVSYPSLCCLEETCWFFLQIHRSVSKFADVADDKLYSLSDNAKRREKDYNLNRKQISLEAAIESAESCSLDSEIEQLKKPSRSESIPESTQRPVVFLRKKSLSTNNLWN
jgi:hypothetical protein